MHVLFNIPMLGCFLIKYQIQIHVTTNWLWAKSQIECTSNLIVHFSTVSEKVLYSWNYTCRFHARIIAGFFITQISDGAPNYN